MLLHVCSLALVWWKQRTYIWAIWHISTSTLWDCKYWLASKFNKNIINSECFCLFVIFWPYKDNHTHISSWVSKTVKQRQHKILREGKKWCRSMSLRINCWHLKARRLVRRQTSCILRRGWPSGSKFSLHVCLHNALGADLRLVVQYWSQT